MLKNDVFIKSLAQSSDHNGAQHWGEGYGVVEVTFRWSICYSGLTCLLDKRLLKVVIICIDVCLEYTLCPNIPFHHICVCSPREELVGTTSPIFLGWVTGSVQAQTLQANG